MRADVHQELGARLRYLSAATCIDVVQTLHPGVRIDEREGRELVFWLDDVRVAHAWPVRGYSLNFWMRVKHSQTQLLKTEAYALR